jgi:hypothetical protein
MNDAIQLVNVFALACSASLAMSQDEKFEKRNGGNVVNVSPVVWLLKLGRFPLGMLLRRL